MANNSKKLQIRDVRIQASPQLWAAWDEWVGQQGCPSRPEAFRLAMRIVINFNSNCQEKNLPRPLAAEVQAEVSAKT